MNNESAIDFYQKFGFQIVETRDHYYKRIEPAGAHVLEKCLRKSTATTAKTTTTALTTESEPTTADENCVANGDITVTQAALEANE